MARKKKAATASKTTTKAASKTSEANKMTAAQRLEGLEHIIMVSEKKFEVLADEIDRLRTLITGLNKRLNASIKAAEEGSLTQDSVNKIIIKQAAKELEDKVSKLVEAGVLEQVTDTETLVTDKSFVVGREIDAKGNELNPRVQFSLTSLDQSLRDKILGHRLGDLVDLSDGNLSTKFEISELYKIVEVDKNKKFASSNPEGSGTEVEPKAKSK